uniref:Uncharacterized protein n=1 Tax=Candidatus Methanophaga sp. ANME-1 ERB7 TaxID=2759913 RepID=A0A7G9Z4N3_9EURY|nr:hypothetical protein MHJDHPNH_00019 [Methanosarcinales archaeon ANME-1 ERB7]
MHSSDRFKIENQLMDAPQFRGRPTIQNLSKKKTIPGFISKNKHRFSQNI